MQVARFGWGVSGRSPEDSDEEGASTRVASDVGGLPCTGVDGRLGSLCSRMMSRGQAGMSTGSDDMRQSGAKRKQNMYGVLSLSAFFLMRVTPKVLHPR